MARYVCRKCEQVVESYSWCPRCGGLMNRLVTPEVVGGTLYNDSTFFSDPKLVVPHGTIDIEQGAFKKCSIGEIELPDTLTSISADCFSKNPDLKKITIPRSVKTIGKGAFSNCTSLEEVIISEGVEEIGENAFSGCTSLEHISIPSTMRKIGNYAIPFDRFKYIALPRGLSEIGEGLFENKGAQAQERLKTQLCLVPPYSNAERYLDEHDLKYRHCGVKFGVATNRKVANKIFLYSNRIPFGKARIPEDVNIIGDYALAGHTEIKEAVFPRTLVEIKDHAFEGCTNLAKISFNYGLKKIGAKAFCNFDGYIVDLPSTVTEVADDAFPANCIISVGGGMPFYAEKTECIERKKRELIIEKQKLRSLQEREESAHKAAQEITLAPTPESTAIELQYKKQLSELQKQINEETQRYFQKDYNLRAEQNTAQARIDSLTEERKKCFFLAVAKKKELDTCIAAENDKVKSIQNEMQQTAENYQVLVDQLNSRAASIKAELTRLQDAKKEKDALQQRLIASCREYALQIANQTSRISTIESQIEKDEAALRGEYKEWDAARKKAEELQKAQDSIREEEQKQEAQRVKIAKLVSKKEKAIARLGVPKYQSIRISAVELFSLKSTDAIIEEEQLNDCYLRLVEELNEQSKASAYIAFAEEHAEELSAIKEINRSLGCSENDGIERFVSNSEPEMKAITLPNRFVALCAYYKKAETWKQLRYAAKTIQSTKRPKANLLDQLFSSVEYIRLNAKVKSVLIFPYCIAVCESGKQIKVLTCEKVRLTVRFTDQQIESEDLPPHSEVLSQTYKYMNKDGTVSRRYKDNPLVKTVRLTTLSLTIENKSVSFPVDSYQAALQFESAFDSFTKNLTSGSQRSVYEAVSTSADYDAIEREIEMLAAKEKAEKQRIRNEEKEAARKKEEERILAQKAAEEKRKQIIQRQREINEERKRQKREKEEAAKSTAKLFSDDFADEMSSSVVQNEKSEGILVKVATNRLISNTVFKVGLQAAADSLTDEIVAFFIAESGECISNKKKILQLSSSSPTTIGFILNSGKDYTAMKKCFLRLEEHGSILCDIEFQMNISFCSDF